MAISATAARTISSFCLAFLTISAIIVLGITAWAVQSDKSVTVIYTLVIVSHQWPLSWVSKGLQKTDHKIGLPYSLFCLYAFWSVVSLLQKADFSCHRLYPGIYPSISVSATSLGNGYHPADRNICKQKRSDPAN